MIEKFDIYMPTLDEMRTIHVYLPNDYQNTRERYPVLYMFDGHNLFLDEDATYGYAWHWQDFLEKQDQKCIIVGQECSHNGNQRLSEYAPFSYEDQEFGYFEGKGKETMEFFIQTLKPHIDKIYRTKKDREYTWIGGSSCGGVMAYYGLVSYSSTYSKAICASPYVMYTYEDLKKFTQNQKLEKNSSFYFSWGALEGGSHGFLQETIRVTSLANICIQKGAQVFFNIKEKGAHTEKDWEDEVPLMLDFLFDNGSFSKK